MSKAAINVIVEQQKKHLSGALSSVVSLIDSQQ